MHIRAAFPFYSIDGLRHVGRLNCRPSSSACQYSKVASLDVIKGDGTWRWVDPSSFDPHCVNKYNVPVVSGYRSKLMVAADWLMTNITFNTGSSSFRVLTHDEALKEFDWDKSAGFPARVPKKVWALQNCLEDLETFWDQLPWDQPAVFWLQKIKEEARKTSKKPRGILPANIYHLYVGVRLNTVFFDAVLKLHDRPGWTVGLPRPDLWAKVSQLKGDTVTSYDWKNFDASAVTSEVIEVLRHIKKQYIPEIYHRHLDWYYDNIQDKYIVLPGNDVYLVHGGQPSGAYTTLFDNDLVAKLWVGVALQEKGLVPTQEDFTRFITFSDDGMHTFEEDFLSCLPFKFTQSRTDKLGSDFLGAKFREISGAVVPVPMYRDKLAASLPYVPSIKPAHIWSKLCNLRALWFFSDACDEDGIPLIARLTQLMFDYKKKYPCLDMGAVHTPVQLFQLWTGSETKQVADALKGRAKLGFKTLRNDEEEY